MSPKNDGDRFSRCPPPRRAATFPPVPPSDLQARVARALSQLKNPRLGEDVLSAGMVSDLAVDEQGQVSFTFRLDREDPGALARDARKAVQAVAGVTAVRVNVADTSAAGGAAPRGAPGAVPPPPTPVELPHLGRTSRG